MAKVWHSKLPETVLSLLRLRCRGMLAAEFAAASLQAHPWGEREWQRIAVSLNRILSLHMQLEGLVNKKAAQRALPPFEFAAEYRAGTSVGPSHRFCFNDFGKNKSAAAKVKARIDERYELSQEPTAAELDEEPLTVHITVRYGADGIRQEEYERFAKAELEFQLGLMSLPPTVRARDGVGITEPISEEQRLWDLRIRLTEFLRRFLEYARLGDGWKWYPHPFTVFFILPRTEALRHGSRHIRSGVFGFSYNFDEGQARFVNEEVLPRWDDAQNDNLAPDLAEGVRFPDGLCSLVYLGASPAQSGSTKEIIDDYRGTTRALATLELLILENSTLLEIPVYEAGTVDAQNGPDGPEIILCVSLPKESEDGGQVRPVERTRNSRRSRSQELFGTADVERISAAIAPPGGSILRPGEAQFIFEVAQRLISRYLTLAPRTPEYGLDGVSSAIQAVRKDIARGCKHDRTVLIMGETGVGKDKVANALHRFHVSRSSGPWVAVNCATFTETLLESELFGHIRGAHNTAHEDRIGKIEAADGGTFFLDEIGDLSPTLQAKLLRVLETKEITPLGGTRARKIDVRFVCATNADLAKAVQEKRFREDLYYRLTPRHAIHVPSLKERREDIPLLVRRLLDEDTRIADEALDLLTRAAWPGNVRDLRDEVDHAASLAADDGNVIAPHHLQVQLEDAEAHVLEPAPAAHETQSEQGREGDR